MRLFYDKEELLREVQSIWGQYDMAIQIFIKQRFMRPYIFRYYIKNANVYKSVCISNQENLNKTSRVYN